MSFLPEFDYKSEVMFWFWEHISQVSSVTRHKTTSMKVKGPLSRYAYGPHFLKRTFVLFLVVDKRMYLYQPQLQVLAAGYI